MHAASTVVVHTIKARRTERDVSMSFLCIWEKIASDFFDTAPAFPAAKSAVFAACRRA
jgi:hypothetical protein